ncbi:MAG: sensor histidine kinase [Actinomycetota bacterium]
MKQLFQTTDTFRNSLRFRLIVASVIIELLMLALMIGNNLRQADRHLTALTQARIDELAETFSVAVGPVLAARDHASLRSLVDRLVALPDVTYLEVHDRDGRTLVAAGETAHGGDDMVRHAEVKVDLYGQVYGFLHYGLSLAALQRARHELLVQGIVIAAAEIFLTVAALSVVAVLLTRKLENLTRASVRFAAGDYATVVGIKGNDEVAALSAAFNAMSAAVREQFKRLEDNAVVLRRSNAELSRMADISAHHLQEPVRRLISYSQLLELRAGGALSSEAADCVATIVADARRLKRLLVDLQAYASLDIDPTAAGTRVDLGRCAADAVVRLRALIEECGGEITVKALPSVVGNPVQLTALFLHLFENALDHRSPERPPHIVVSASRTDHSEMVAVRDNGPGIPPDYRDQVFDLFTRLDSQSGGTGIGLAMVKKIVESHGGHVWIEPNRPAGTSVNFVLPAPDRP